MALKLGLATRLPDRYSEMTVGEMEERVRGIKERMGKKLVILGHHYQRDEVFQFADYIGDSLKLAQLAADQREARYIVFCGVHFMAETADILTAPHQAVILPDLKAGCSMADMADDDELKTCWLWLKEQFGEAFIPVSYVNSTAAVKAFCGQHNGLTCTSSNARRILEWVLKQGKRVLFLPDEHLGRNTAYALGVPLEEMAVYNPATGELEGLQTAPDKLKVVLWKGFCSVHQHFKLEHVRRVREKDPEVKVLVHPECSFEVVQAADLCGSTEFIIRQVEQAPAGTRWAIGTEMNLVGRLAKRHPEQKIKLLNDMICSCLTMNRIDLPHLLWALEEIEAGRIPNRIVVAEEVAALAKKALERMLALS